MFYEKTAKHRNTPAHEFLFNKVASLKLETIFKQKHLGTVVLL